MAGEPIGRHRPAMIGDCGRASASALPADHTRFTHQGACLITSHAVAFALQPRGHAGDYPNNRVLDYVSSSANPYQWRSCGALLRELTRWHVGENDGPLTARTRRPLSSVHDHDSCCLDPTWGFALLREALLVARPTRSTQEKGRPALRRCGASIPCAARRLVVWTGGAAGNSQRYALLRHPAAFYLPGCAAGCWRSMAR
jgi:hypothetical protein